MTCACHLPFDSIKIDSFGNVYNCCYQKTPIGNILQTSIIDIFNNNLNNEIRLNLLKNSFHNVCKETKTCPVILNKNKNVNVKICNFPINIEIELPNFSCNIGGKSPSPKTACIMCPRSSPDFKPQTEDLTLKILDKIKPFLKNILTLKITGLAEPFYNNNVFKIFKYLKIDKSCKIKFFIITNATLLNKNISRKLLSYTDNLDLTFSLDAGTTETYIKIRKFKNFKRVIENIKYFNEIKPKTVTTNINCNLNLLNIHEYSEIINLCKYTITDNLVFRPTIEDFNIAHLKSISLKNIDFKNLKLLETQMKTLATTKNVNLKFIVPLSCGM